MSSLKLTAESLKLLPKIDLHRHLEGSVRFDTLRELARELKLGLSDAELRRRTTMKGERPDFRRFLSKFALYRGLYPSREWIERVAFEAVEDAKNDGVVYLELRFSPTHFGRRMDAKGEDVAEWIARGARRAKLPVTFIATFGRDFGVDGNRPTLRAVEGTDVFSGLDLAGDEACPAEPFRDLFKRLNLPCTIHAGEAGPAANVREAIDRFGARRIGHGVRALRDRRLLEYAWEKDVHFELCLASNVQTGAARSWEDHPAWQVYRSRIPVRFSLNTDDPSICGTTLSRELGLARRHGGWDRALLYGSQLFASCAAFLPSDAARKLQRRVGKEWGFAQRNTVAVPRPLLKSDSL